jgi:glycosyltransferase involved in cell wall biosynthesis
MGFPLASFASRPRCGLTVLLDDAALDASGREDWSAFILFAANTLGMDVSVASFSGNPPDDGRDFAYIADSAALSRKLLLNVPLIYIQPRAAPAEIDAYLYWKSQEQGVRLYSWQPVQHPVTLISSVFRGDEFLPGFLSNCAGLTGYEDYEHFLIRAASPGDEHDRLVDHVRQWPSAVYLYLATDPGLYEVWNLGTRLSTGRYLTNANIDDRRAPDHVTHLRAILDRDPEVDVTSSALRVSKQRNLTWEDSDSCPNLLTTDGDRRVFVGSLMKRTTKGVVIENLPHCMPLWRRSLHARVGKFEESRYGPVADKAFWLKAGKHGSTFFLSADPRGLYLWDSASYFHRDGMKINWDQNLLVEFSDLVELHGKPAFDCFLAPFFHPLSHEIDDTIYLFRSGAVYEGISKLLHFALHANRLGETELALISRVAKQYLAFHDFASLAAIFRSARGPGYLTDIAVFNIWVDLVHALDEETVKSRRTLELACIDLEECLGDFRGLLLFAMVARKRGHLALERKLLRHLHDADRTMFWMTVQQVYRFTVPLPELCRAVSDISPQFEPKRSLADYQVTFYPVSSENAYQRALYQPLREASGVASGASDEDEFLGAVLQPNSENVLHVHWIGRMFWPPEVRGKSIKQRARVFLDGLRKQQMRGFKIFWTVHNHLSHETDDPAAEAAFRHELYLLADRVFIHHPLAADLLDWLPDRGKLCLSEHGHYDLSSSQAISRSAARDRLGLGEDDFIVAHLGHIRDYKGLSEVLPVLVSQLEKNPRMKLLVAGRIRSGEVDSWLKAHPNPNLLVHDGYLSDEDLLCWMRAADFGMLSYVALLTSGSLFHWLSSGRPVLAPLSGTIPAYLVDGWNGYGYRDAESLQQLLDHCAELPVGERERMGNNAYMTARQLEWRMWKQRSAR